MTPWPAWLRLGLVLPLVGLNAFVLKRVLVQFAPFPGLFLTAALIAFLLDLPCRWLMRRGLSRTGSIALVMLITVALSFYLARSITTPITPPSADTTTASVLYEIFIYHLSQTCICEQEITTMIYKTICLSYLF